MMDKQKAAVAIGLALKQAPPSAVEAGTDFSLSVELNWPDGISHEGATYRVRDGKRTTQDGPLPEPSADGSVALQLRAPDEVGEHRLTLIVASAEQENRKAVEGALSIVVTSVPHETSLAVWDVPSPVVTSARFEIKAGAKCSATCGLAGKVIEIRDDEGSVMGSGVLGKTTLPGTTALYFTTIELKAPRKRALHAWTASFAPSELKLPHGGATSSFSFVTVAKPDHSVSVTVINKETKAPIAGAQVRLGVYRAVTDNAGAAKVSVPKGKFPLVVTRPGYKMPERAIAVSKDVRVRIAAEKLPEEDPYALWTA